MSNYADRDGEELNIANGQLTLTDDSAGKLEGNVTEGWTFTAAENYNGIASFEFGITDNVSTTPGTITVEINAVNDSPRAQNGNTFLANVNGTPLTIEEEEVLSIKKSDLMNGINDVDNEINELEITYIYSENGVIKNVAGKEEWLFTPERNYNGVATISYGISDGNGGLLEHTRTLNITAVDDKPNLISAPNVFTDIPEDSSLTINAVELLSFYGDADGDALEITRLSINNKEINPNDEGNYIFTPNQDYNGIAEINYTVKGGAGELLQTQYLMVTPINDAPTAANNTIDVVMNEAHTFEITDFGFADTIDNDEFGKVRLKVSDPENIRISSLPQSTEEILITAQQIADGLVTYKAGSIGTAKTIEFSVIDDGDTTNQNSVNESEKYTMTISGIAPAVNDEALLKSFQVKDAVKEIARSMSSDGSIPLETVGTGADT